jgi:hypothetical protein
VSAPASAAEQAALEVDLERIFSHHAPKGDQAYRYSMLRREALEFARAITDMAPSSRERSLAITHLRTALMWANAAIACNE